MRDPFAWFWIAMILSSIVWYGSLLLIVGVKGGREIIKMTQNLSAKTEDGKNDAEHD